MLTPIWVGPLLAIGMYVLLRFVIPPLIATDSESLVGNVFGAVSQYIAPLGGAGVLVIWVVAEVKKFSRRRLLDSRSGIGSLRAMSWQEFEQLVGEAYRRQGYAVEESGGSGADGGVDLILRKAGATTLVQCKQWKTRKVGVKIVRELYGVMAAEQAPRGVVVTCGHFTNEANAFADGNPVDLVDGPALWELVQAVKTGKKSTRTPPRESNQATATRPPAPRIPEDGKIVPLCPMCGSKMVLRTARKGSNPGEQFYGCPHFPKCRGTRKIEAHAS